jgi:hypothetical protein
LLTILEIHVPHLLIVHRSGAPASRNTFLVNAHFDTQNLTPGAQDNGCGGK